MDDDARSVLVVPTQHGWQRQRHVALAPAQPRLLAIPAAQLPAAQAMSMMAFAIPQHDAATVGHARRKPASRRTERRVRTDAVDPAAVDEQEAATAIFHAMGERIDQPLVS